nr:MAG TPA: hypothetical protein [Caudoviricetes sp.]
MRGKFFFAGDFTPASFFEIFSGIFEKIQFFLFFSKK